MSGVLFLMSIISAMLFCIPPVWISQMLGWTENPISYFFVGLLVVILGMVSLAVSVRVWACIGRMLYGENWISTVSRTDCKLVNKFLCGRQMQPCLRRRIGTPFFIRGSVGTSTLRGSPEGLPF